MITCRASPASSTADCVCVNAGFFCSELPWRSLIDETVLLPSPMRPTGVLRGVSVLRGISALKGISVLTALSSVAFWNT
jgi:hypothetical protein